MTAESPPTSTSSEPIWTPQGLYIYFLSIRLFLCHFMLVLKCCNLPCVKILSDSCNEIWVPSWGWHFLHCHCATTNSTERTGQEGIVIGRTCLPWSDLSYPEHGDMLWQSINRSLKKPGGVQMPQTRPLLSTHQAWKIRSYIKQQK